MMLRDLANEKPPPRGFFAFVIGERRHQAGGQALESDYTDDI
jgi:hypothetical protein